MHTAGRLPFRLRLTAFARSAAVGLLLAPLLCLFLALRGRDTLALRFIGCLPTLAGPALIHCRLLAPPLLRLLFALRCRYTLALRLIGSLPTLAGPALIRGPLLAPPLLRLLLMRLALVLCSHPTALRLKSLLTLGRLGFCPMGLLDGGPLHHGGCSCAAMPVRVGSIR